MSRIGYNMMLQHRSVVESGPPSVEMIESCSALRMEHVATTYFDSMPQLSDAASQRFDSMPQVADATSKRLVPMPESRAYGIRTLEAPSVEELLTQ